MRVEARASSAPVLLRGGRSCEDLLGWFRERARELVVAGHLDRIAGVVAEPAAGPVQEGGTATSRGAAGGDAATSTAGAATAGTSTGGSNVVEAGVDEPDRVKVVADLVVAVATPSPVVEGRTRILQAGHAGLSLRSTVVGPAERVMLEGRDLLTVTTAGLGTRFQAVDLSDPAAPRPGRALEVQGQLVAVRRVGRTVHVVTSSPAPRIELRWPQSAAVRAAREAESANLRTIATTRLDEWLPGRPDCAAVHTPTEFAGFGRTVVTSFPIEDPSAAAETVVVGGAGGPGAVHAGRDDLYVATSEAGWDGTSLVRSGVHRFALGERAAYLGSGTVPGVLRSDFAMSPFEGHLRVVTDAVSDGRLQARLTVLRVDDDRLPTVGELGGFTTGEITFGIRFVGPIGFVVTAVALTDPIHVVDVTDPAAPRMRGVLDVSGFSEYLHDIGGARLLGVGPDGEGRGEVTITDVADLDEPRRVGALTLGGSVRGDHLSFTWEAVTRRAVVLRRAVEEGVTVASVVQVDGHRPTLVGEVRHGPRREEQRPRSEHEPLTPAIPGAPPAQGTPSSTTTTPPPLPDWRDSIAGARVVNGQLLTFSARELVVTDLATLARAGSVPFP